MTNTKLRQLVNRLEQSGKPELARRLVQAFNLNDGFKRNHLDPVKIKKELAEIQEHDLDEVLTDVHRFVPASANWPEDPEETNSQKDLTVPRDVFPPPEFPPRSAGLSGPYPPGIKRGIDPRAPGIFPGTLGLPTPGFVSRTGPR